MKHDIHVSFPGGKRVDAALPSGHVVRTDQPVAGGGEGSAPEPFQHFLASLATCAGIYVLGFCQSRGIATEGIELTQGLEVDPTTGRLARVAIDITLPAGFPEKYRDAVVQAAAKCKVKRVLADPPEIVVTAGVAAGH